MSYIPGDFWRVCDRCGFNYRASQAFKTWDGLYVCAEDFETRHPQDFVRGRKDRQAVPDPRSVQLETLVGPLATNISIAAANGATTINVESSVRFMATDRIGVVLDNGDVGSVTVFSVPTATSIQLATPLRGAAAVGNIVVNYSAVATVDIG